MRRVRQRSPRREQAQEGSELQVRQVTINLPVGTMQMRPWRPCTCAPCIPCITTDELSYVTQHRSELHGEGVEEGAGSYW